MNKLIKFFIITTVFGVFLPIIAYGVAYSDYSNVTDKTVTAVSGCAQNEDCSGDTPCCNLQTGQCVENYGKCGGLEPKSATKAISIVSGKIGACLIDIKPNKGKWGTLATMSGEAFGDSKGSSEATFNSAAGRLNADYSDTGFQWTNTSIKDAKVPINSMDGDVKVLKEGIESNGISFDVIGAEGDLCNQDFSDLTCQIDNDLCSNPLLCDALSCRCQYIPGTGEPCDADKNSPGCQLSHAICQNFDPRLGCDAEKDCTCQPIPGIGASCDTDEAANGCQFDHGICQQYDPLLTCDINGDVGEPCTCQIVEGQGQPCSEGEDACENNCDRFGNPSLTCDVNGIYGDPCTCTVIDGLGEPCSEGEDACFEDNCSRFEEPLLFCDLEGIFNPEEEPCTCQIDPNIGAPCYEGAAVEQCNLEMSTCEQRNTKYRKYFCDPAGEIDPTKPCTCQLYEPTIVKTYPKDGDANVCRNAMISVTFSKILDKRTISLNNILLFKEEKLVEIELSSYNEDSDADRVPDRTVVMAAPLKMFTPGAQYKAVVKGGKDGIKDLDGIAKSHDYSWSFTAGSEICKIDHLDIIIAPPGSAKTYDWFRCARNDCPDDQDPALDGSQHIYFAQARDVAGVPLAASYRWSKDDAESVISELTYIADAQTLTVQNKNGQAVVYIQADGAEAGVVTGQVDVNVFLCENPWPPIDEFPYQDTLENPKPTGSNPTNFSIYYCRDPKSPMKPSLQYPPTVVNGPAINDIGQISKENLIKEFLFPNKVFKAGGVVTLSRDILGTEQISDGVWEYEFNLPEKGIYRAFAELTNADKDLSSSNIYFQIKVSLDGVAKETFYSVASLQSQRGGVVLGNVEKGNHTIRYEWVNRGTADLNLNLSKIGVEKGSLLEDVIGIRIYNNPEDFSISEWYKKNVPNPGAPETLKVADYDALKDERTVYVSVPNVEKVEEDPVTGRITVKTYGVVYLMSYNKGASEETMEIFDELVINWKFYPKMIDSTKEKEEVKRDRQREADIKIIRTLLEIYKETYGYYPKLEKGSYVAGETNSRWPSWQTALAAALGQQLPIDPINKFRGVCSNCPDNPNKSDYQCGGTCWNDETKFFQWPTQESPQLVYRYVSLNGGAEYRLDYENEYGRGCKLSQCEDAACPVNQFGFHCCEPGSCCLEGGEGERKCTLGSYCALGSWVSSCGDNIAQCGEECDTGGVSTQVTEDCLDANGYKGKQNKICGEMCVLSEAGNCATYERCGDGIKNGNEQCDNGTRNGVICQPAYKRDAPGSCTYCDKDCKSVVFSAGPYCGDNKTWAAEEACDAGADNGSPCTPIYGKSCHYCSADCKKLLEVKGPYCGDSQTNGSETCDDGEDATQEKVNGRLCVPGYGQTCSYCGKNCQTITLSGPRCGDQIKNGPADAEECDGDGGLNVWACPAGETKTCGTDCLVKCSLGGAPTKGALTGAKIVLTWGNDPKDLDAHLEFGSITQNTHIYYAHKDLTNGSRMDVDDTNGNGPETITVASLVVSGDAPNYYRYYARSSALENFQDGAKVQIFNTANELIKNFDIADATVNLLDGVSLDDKYENKYWYVFDLIPETGRIVERNLMFNERVKPVQCGDGKVSYLDFEECDGAIVIPQKNFLCLAADVMGSFQVCRDCQVQCAEGTSKTFVHPSTPLSENNNKITLKWFDQERPIESSLRFGENTVSLSNPTVGGVTLQRTEGGGQEEISISNLSSNDAYKYSICQNSSDWWWGLEEVRVINSNGVLIQYYVPSAAEAHGFKQCWRVFDISGQNGKVTSINSYVPSIP